MSGPVVLTGGGTGGHIFPMQAIADALVAEGVSPAQLRYVGSRRGQEATLLGGGPVALTLLPGRGIRRSLAPQAWRDNAGALWALSRAMVRALVDVGRWRPRVVVSVGGYAAAAVSTAAILWRRPLVLVDLDAAPSVTNRLLGRFARVRCVAFGTPSDRVRVTGAPVRADVLAIDRSAGARRAAKALLEPPIDPDRRVVVVMTGSLGATSVNRAVVELASLWRDRTDLALVHVSGRRDFDMVSAARPAVRGLDYRIIDFAQMSTWWALADVAICRAGATTIAELTSLGLPAILVPLPGAPGDHQTHNADALAVAGAARRLRDDECSGPVLASWTEDILREEVWGEMARASAALARRDAAAQIAREVLAQGAS